VSFTVVPGEVLATLLRKVFPSVTGCPWNAVTTSPLRSPARAAGLFGGTAAMSTPPGCLTPRLAA